MADVFVISESCFIVSAVRTTLPVHVVAGSDSGSVPPPSRDARDGRGDPRGDPRGDGRGDPRGDPRSDPRYEDQQVAGARVSLKGVCVTKVLDGFFHLGACSMLVPGLFQL